MKTRYGLLIATILMILACSKKENPEKQTITLTSYVDPFIGSANGNIFPGVSLPFGMVKLGPNVDPPISTNGYRKDKPIVGFSHNHTSGTGGGPRYGNIMIIPQAGELTITDYISLKKVNEYSAPGMYAVTLARKQGDVACKLTALRKTGMHNYRFYTWDNKDSLLANLLIDVSHTNTRGKETDARCLEAETEVISPTEAVGYAKFAGGWGGDLPYTIYFYAVCDLPAHSSGTWKDEVIQEGIKKTKGNNIGAYFSYSIAQEQEIKMKVAISYKSIEQAKENCKEIEGWRFDSVRNQAEDTWNDYLSKIIVDGGSLEERRLFYSCLRNTMLMPTDITGENPSWESSEPHFWDHYCLWDVFRSVMPLHTLLYLDVQASIIKSLVDIYKHEGWFPDAWVAGNFADIQGGTHIDVVIADAIVKGLTDFDIQQAYEGLLKNAEEQSDDPKRKGRFINDYKQYGYLVKETTDGASSRTIEYAYNDFCIAQVALSLGKENDYNHYLERSKGVFTLFYDSVNYFWAKDSSGNWEPDFTLHSKRSDHWNDPFFYEGGSELYSYFVPHDMEGLIKRHGSKENFIRNLDDFFESGRFELSNEPVFLVPYSYNYAGRPDKTARRVRDILAKEYNPGEAGLPGQDDSGAMSSWYVFSAMGFFPVAGQDVYLIGSPLFASSTITLDKEKTFTIIANHVSSNNIYIKSATLNGIKWDKNWFRHSDIINGGSLVLEMTDVPSTWGQQDLPPSLSK